MPDSPSAHVYNGQFLGDATILGSGLAPLQAVQFAARQRAAQQAREAAARAALERSLPGTPDLNMNGSEYFQPQLQASADAVAKTARQASQDAVSGKISRSDYLNILAQEKARHNGLAQTIQDHGKVIDQIKSTIRENNLDPAAVAQGLPKVLSDPANPGQIIDARKFDPAALATFAQNPDYFNKGAVVEKFVKGLMAKQESDYTTAARPGQTGQSNSFASNFFENDGHGKVVMIHDANGNLVPKIRDIARFEQAAMRDPQMAALLRRQQEIGAQPSAAALMANPAGLNADAQLETLNGATDAQTPNSQKTLANILRDYGTMTQKSRQLSPMAIPKPAASAAGKLKVGDAVATPTSDFGLSVGDNGGPVTETTPNTEKGGLFNFLTPTKTTSVNRPQPFDNHYPHVGTSFASAKSPYVTLSANSNEFTTLGADGTVTKYGNNKTNSLVPFHATDRSLVLESNGKRMGLPKGGSSADAYEEMKGMIERMTPEQARKAVLKAYWQGGVTDKGKTGGDGTGEKARIVGYKDASGELITDAEAATAKRNGEAISPVYDQTESMVKVMRPATAQLDAQAARQTPGYDPRKRTAQEQDLIRRLEAKGGKVEDPYHTTKPTTTGGHYTPKITAKAGTGGLY